MKYSLDELDRMRAAIHFLLFGGGGSWYVNQREQDDYFERRRRRVDDELHTHMLNETPVETLEEKAGIKQPTSQNSA